MKQHLLFFVLILSACGSPKLKNNIATIDSVSYRDSMRMSILQIKADSVLINANKLAGDVALVLPLLQLNHDIVEKQAEQISIMVDMLNKYQCNTDAEFDRKMKKSNKLLHETNALKLKVNALVHFKG